MLTKRLPFSGATRMYTMVAVLDRKPCAIISSREGIYLSAPLLQSIVDRCLSKETTERYQTAGELLADLKNAREQLNNAIPTINNGEQNSRACEVLIALCLDHARVGGVTDGHGWNYAQITPRIHNRVS